MGVHVIGEQASELAHNGLMAMLNGSSVELFNRVGFNYPRWESYTSMRPTMRC